MNILHENGGMFVEYECDFPVRGCVFVSRCSGVVCGEASQRDACTVGACTVGRVYGEVPVWWGGCGVGWKWWCVVRRPSGTPVQRDVCTGGCLMFMVLCSEIHQVNSQSYYNEGVVSVMCFQLSNQGSSELDRNTGQGKEGVIWHHLFSFNPSDAFNR